jgi:hypothetical protein
VFENLRNGCQILKSVAIHIINLFVTLREYRGLVCLGKGREGTYRAGVDRSIPDEYEPLYGHIPEVEYN